MTNIVDSKVIAGAKAYADQKQLLDKAQRIRAQETITRHENSKLYETELVLDITDTDLEEIKSKAFQDLADRSKAIYIVNSDLNKFMTLAPRSLCLIAASTGTGKSTFTANLVFSSMIKERKKILVIVNEESTQDVMIRVSCLLLGISIHKYKDKDINALSMDDREKIIQTIDKIKPFIDIIGKEQKTKSGLITDKFVTTLEGIQQVLDKSAGKYHCIIIDYYQNITSSTAEPGLDEYTVQARFAEFLNSYRDRAGCPIILLAQIRKEGKVEQDAKVRLEGRKIIWNYATDVLEMTVDRDQLKTVFKCQKDRWLGNNGRSVDCGYEDGKFVLYDEKFKKKVEDRQQQYTKRKQDEKMNQLADQIDAPF